MEHGNGTNCGNARLSVYREFAPRRELREYVRALAWYGPADEAPAVPGACTPSREFYVGGDAPLAPSFADAHACLLFPLGWNWSGNIWQQGSASDATVMGALTRATRLPSAERSAMIGVYLRPRGCAALLGTAAVEVTDRVVALRDVWKGFDDAPDALTLQGVETLVVRRLAKASPPTRAMHLANVAAYVDGCGGRITVGQMANAAGLSRQHLARLFLEHVGVSPKLFARLARFRAGLRCIGQSEHSGGWSRLAARLGYADQSHLIAEFREFAAFTPETLVRENYFHPFIGNDR